MKPMKTEFQARMELMARDRAFLIMEVVDEIIDMLEVQGCSKAVIEAIQELELRLIRKHGNV